MGYYTHFRIETEGEQPDTEKLESDFNRITDGYSFMNISDDTRKWYDYDSNMTELSRLYPSTIFHVWGEGEDSGDIWHHVFCNGESKQVYAKTIYPDIDIKSIGNIGERHPEFFI